MSTERSACPRFGPSIFALAILTSLMALGVSNAQETPAASAMWEVPRTPAGHPDLQGNWTNATLTPFVRPEGHGPVLTPQQVIEIEQMQADAVARGAAPSDPNRAPPPAGGDDPECIDSATGCYNEVYRNPGDHVAVVNGEPRSSLITFPADGRPPTLTEEGERRIQERRDFRAQFGSHDHPELLHVGLRCLTSFGSNAGPPMLPNYWYNNNYTIVQTADHVMIVTEMVHDVRVIRLGERKPLPPAMRPWFGDSWGHWEGDTLVVETINRNPEVTLWGVPPSAEARVIERFRRVDEDNIHYEFTIDDPTMYTADWGGEVPFQRFDDALYEYACHEANYSMANVLSGARYEEQTEERR